MPIPKALVERARQGDRVAFGELWSDYLRPVALRTAIRLGVRKSDIDDAVSEVCLQVLKKLEQLQELDKAKAWVRAVATRLLQRMVPRNARRDRHAELTPEVEAPTVTGRGDAAQAAALVEAMIRNRLGGATRTVCCRLLLDGATRAAVAAELGISIHRVDLMLLVGVEKLREWARADWAFHPVLGRLLGDR
jgi:RNA polymerase sigma factor (sigma-70 family)